MESGLDTVDAEISGMLLALTGLGADESALQALDRARRASCARAWQALRELDESERARTLEGWRVGAACTLPMGLRSLHQSWIDDALAGESAEVVGAIRRGLGARGAIPEETGRELARMAFGRLAPLCESMAGPLAERLCGLEFDGLLAEVTRRGARAVGRSLAAAAPSLLARAMASVGEPWAAEIAVGAWEPATAERRAAAAALASAATASEGHTAGERLLAVGLASLKAELAAEGAGSRMRVAGRLPAALGRALIGW